MKNIRESKKSGAKKVVGAIVACAVLATSAVALVSCSALDGDNSTADNRLKSKQIYSMSAVTGTEYLADNNMSNVATVGYSTVADTITSRPENITDNTMDTIDQFIGMFQGMLIGDGINQVESAPTVDVDGVYSDYKTKVVVSLPTLAGEKAEYIMYYTESASDSEVAVADDDEDDEEEDFDTDEVSTTLTGVIVMNDEVYDISGSKTVETEGEEVETEIEFMTKFDDNNWVKVNEEKELNEVEYEYTFMTDGVETKTAIEYESVAGIEELSLEVEDANGVEVEYSIEVKEKNGIKVFEVEYVNEETSTEDEIIVTPLEDGTYEFEFKNGHKEIR